MSNLILFAYKLNFLLFKCLKINYELKSLITLNSNELKKNGLL